MGIETLDPVVAAVNDVNIASRFVDGHARRVRELPFALAFGAERRFVFVACLTESQRRDTEVQQPKHRDEEQRRSAAETTATEGRARPGPRGAAVHLR